MTRGVARIFQRGVTLCQSEGTHQIVMSSSPTVGLFASKKAYQKRGDMGGRDGHPRTPSSYHPILPKTNTKSEGSENVIDLKFEIRSQSRAKYFQRQPLIARRKWSEVGLEPNKTEPALTIMLKTRCVQDVRSCDVTKNTFAKLWDLAPFSNRAPLKRVLAKNYLLIVISQPRYKGWKFDTAPYKSLILSQCQTEGIAIQS